jgi:hypothetical protein
MELKGLGPISIGIAGAASAGGIGIMAPRLAAGQDSPVDTSLMLAASFITTSLIAALGLTLNYRLERLALQARAAATQRSLELRITQLELQRAILKKIQDGATAAHAYQRMTAADTLCTAELSKQNATICAQPPSGSWQATARNRLRRLMFTTVVERTGQQDGALGRGRSLELGACPPGPAVCHCEPV